MLCNFPNFHNNSFTIALDNSLEIFIIKNKTKNKTRLKKSDECH